MNDKTLKIYAHVYASSYRVKVVKTLKDEIKTPTMISKDTGILLNHISNVLRDLKESQVAECINEDYRKGRLYRLTDIGNEIADNLK